MSSALDIASPRLSAFRRVLDVAIPGAVRRVVLFGSRARGEAPAGSDYDVAVFVRQTGLEAGEIRRRVADAAFDQMIEGLHLAPITLPEDYLDLVDGHYRTELARRIASEGVEI
jgi:predicted nucleotidyltransferase